MSEHRILIWAVLVTGFACESPSLCLAQAVVPSPSPPNVEYQYQLYYPRWYGWPGPGLSLGGSLPSRGREGISSFYGRPLPVPLGAGVFVNPFAYATQLPGPFSFGLAANGPSTTGYPTGTSQPMMSGTNPSNPLNQQVSPPAPAPITRPVVPSSSAAVERSREMESFGDDNLTQRQWMQAYVNYRNATQTADDRAEPHFRLGIACLALKHFPEAAREFTRALTIDPTLAKSSELLATIVGPESEPLRAEWTRNVAQWTREDLRDQDRLFLLGVVLHYADDSRGKEILEAAYRMTGSGDHLVALLTPVTREPVQSFQAKYRIEPKASVAVDSESSDPAPRPSSIDSISALIPKLPPAPSPEPAELEGLPELHRQPLALRVNN